MGKHRRQKQTSTSTSRVRRTAWIAGAMALAAVALVGVVLLAGRSGEDAGSSRARVSATESPTNEPALPVVHVHKSPTCGCCSKWVDHLREQGFEVRTTDTHDLTEFKASHGVPRQLGSCHTALVAGYVL